MAKGAKVSVEGHLRWHQWQDNQTGQNRSKLSVIVDEVELMQQKQNGQQTAPQQPQAAPQIQQGFYQAPQAQTYQQLTPKAYQQPMQVQPMASAQPMAAAQPIVATVYDEEIPF